MNKYTNNGNSDGDSNDDSINNSNDDSDDSNKDDGAKKIHIQDELGTLHNIWPGSFHYKIRSNTQMVFLTKASFH